LGREGGKTKKIQKQETVHPFWGLVVDFCNSEFQ